MLYKKFEIHITIDPCKNEIDLNQFKLHANSCGFKVADLLKRTGERSDKDEFCTAHDISYKLAKKRCESLVSILKENGFNVRRFKIEHILLDSRNGDQL